ncbi:hypothetical protein CH276_28035 [Rhodococcus sp. 06-470-2]|uniref:aggregation-promoting factor C-terminal-like domain-containing protein n=1 Tax=unclassified Rhodococcus (in: high G+C Gram-positive bacteria) TaxID=192944 RepID=UPI000B9B14F1|nr:MULTISPECIES: hypothetical protein [unclassified Rhodococcus (in: high G+C Gram-positive bacteria)]OZC55959.1 hypothetical protein CH276_28035 [Rhodococcus sp. 06-470-2]OZE64839.1 hypothetical protein CH265_10355 [Rhodococcus sp. 05-2221-1B]
MTSLQGGETYINVMPSMDGYFKRVRTAVKNNKVTQHVDVDLDRKSLNKARAELDKSMKDAAAARKKDAAAAGSVIAAEKQLLALRQKDTADATRLAAAEAKVAKAKRDSHSAATALNAAEAKRSSTSNRVSRIETKLDTRRAESDSDSFLQRIGAKFGRGGEAVGATFVSGISKAVNSNSAGSNEGRGFIAGFASAIGTGMRATVAGFAVASSAANSMIRNVSTTALVIGLAARAARGFGMAMLASSVAVRAISGAGLVRLAGVLRLAARAAGILARDIGRVTAALLVMAAVARVTSMLTRLGRTLGMVTVGSAAALGAVAALGSVVANFVAGPMVQGLTAIAAAMGTVAAAAAGILGPAIAVAGIAFSGLSAGAKAWTDSQKAIDTGSSKTASAAKAVESAQKSQARTAEQGARQIVEAEKDVVDAQEDVKDAQDDVNKARQEATRDAAGYSRSLKGLALDEEGASLSLAEAQKTLRETLADPEADNLDRWRANLGVREAEQAFEEIKASSEQERAEISDAQAKGIEGSDKVVDAKNREVDAQQRLSDAQTNLAQTQKDVAQANVDAAEAVADAYASMAEAQSGGAVDPFDAMIGERMSPMMTAFKDMRHEITDKFSGAMVGAFGKMGGLLGTLTPQLGGLATTLGTIGSKVVDALSSPEAIDGLNRMIAGSKAFFDNFTGDKNGIGNLFSGLIQVLGTAAETFAGTGATINDFLFSIGERLKGISADDLKDSLAGIGSTFQSIGNVVGPLFDLMRQFGGEAASGLAPGFAAMGKAISDSIPGLMDMARVLMPALGQALVNLAPVLPALVSAFSPWAEILAVLAPIIATVLTNLAPMAPLLLGIVTAVKLIGISLTIWNAAMFGASVAQGVFAAATGRSAASLGANTVALAAHRVALLAGTVAQTAWNAVTNFGIVTSIRAAAAWVASKAVMVATSVATGIATAAQWALNAALSANPIGLIIALLAGLVAAVVLAYKNSETFRSIVQAAWKGIQDAVSWAWENVLKPYLGFLMDRLRELGTVVSWLYDNIVKPYFEFIGSVISSVVDGAMSAFDAFMGGLQKVGDFVKSVAGGIESAWNSVRGYLAKPVNFMIDTVFNNGILKAWNAIAGFLPGIEPMMPLATIPEYAKGGQLRGPGTGTSDDILMWGSNDEHMVTAKEVDRAGGHNVVYAIRDMIARGIPFTWDNGQIVRKLGRDNLDRYGAEVALKGIGNADPAGMFQQLLPRYKDGGAIRAGAPWEKALEGGHEFAKAHHGDPYAWGEWDCSAFMSRVADKILGGTGEKNWFTGSFPGTQPWVKGLGKGMSVGVHDDPGGPGGGHTAGTLSAAGPYATANIESGGSPSMVKYAIGAAGADSAQFQGVTPGQYHLAIGADGSFESGGLTGGGPTAQNKASFLQSKIADVMDKALNPIKDTIAAAIGSPPPEYLGIPPKYLDAGRDKASGFLADTALNLGDKLSEAWDKAKDIGNVLTGGLFRDRGGWIPGGRSLVNNETGKPEAILNWEQVFALRDLFMKGDFAGVLGGKALPQADPAAGTAASDQAAATAATYGAEAKNAFDVDWLGVGAQIGTSLFAEWGNDLFGMGGFDGPFKGMSLVDDGGRSNRNEASYDQSPTGPADVTTSAPTQTPAPTASPVTPTAPVDEKPAESASVVDKVKAAFKPYGWDSGEQWAAADWIIGKESSWNPLARNPSSGAFSLFQFLGSTKDQYLPDENPDAYVQGKAGAKYIKDRYGDPLAAKSFWEKNNWYDQGGRATGKGFMLKNVIHPERVLSPRQTEAFEQLVPMLDQMQLATTAPGDVLSQSSRNSLEYAPVKGGATYNVQGRVDRETMRELGIHERQDSRKYTSRNR